MKKTWSLKTLDARKLNRDLEAIPEDVKEKFYRNFVHHQCERRCHLQKIQINSIKKFGRFLNDHTQKLAVPSSIEGNKFGLYG